MSTAQVLSGGGMGPLSSAAAGDLLEDQIRRAIEQGATLATGGARDGNYFPGTVLTDVRPDNDAHREEFFGPVDGLPRQL